jgi:hypothetical protein
MDKYTLETSTFAILFLTLRNTIDSDSIFGSHRRECLRHKLLSIFHLLRKLHECLVNIFTALGTDLEELHIVLLGNGVSLLVSHLSLIVQVAFSRY